MNKLKRSKQIFLLAGALSLFIISGLIHTQTLRPRIEISKQDSALNLNQDLFKFFSLGNKQLFADLLWIQTLIESDIEHYAQKDLNGWLYLRFMTISQLDPLFYENYMWGGRYLSIIKDDVLGATKLLERGILYYPTDYKLLSTLGFAYFYELEDYPNGIKHLEKIINSPEAPVYFKSLVSKMKLEQKLDYDAELLFIQGFLKETRDKNLHRKLTQDFYSLKAERDLKCLNNRLGGCDQRDARNAPYVLINGKYHSQTAFMPYRLKKKRLGVQTQTMTTME
jgi:tetratricopeptide (TPR) repeat protein